VTIKKCYVIILNVNFVPRLLLVMVYKIKKFGGILVYSEEPVFDRYSTIICTLALNLYIVVVKNFRKILIFIIFNFIIIQIKV
jgi:hypothetical protein